MKSIIKKYLVTIAVATAIVSCTKNNDAIDVAANTANTAATTFSLNNRVLAAFVIDSSSIPGLPAGTLPAGYNKFRKQLTYDTIASANKPKVYNVGDTVIVLAYVKGDDNAIGKRNINFKFFGIPTFYTSSGNWIKVTTNPPQSPIQAAEDSIRGFAPRSIDVFSTVSRPAIAEITDTLVSIKKVGTGQVNSINNTTYLVQLNYIIPVELSGKLTSINFAVGTGNLKNDLGNVNWNYAFKVR